MDTSNKIHLNSSTRKGSDPPPTYIHLSKTHAQLTITVSLIWAEKPTLYYLCECMCLFSCYFLYLECLLKSWPSEIICTFKANVIFVILEVTSCTSTTFIALNTSDLELYLWRLHQLWGGRIRLIYFFLFHKYKDAVKYAEYVLTNLYTKCDIFKVLCAKC